MNGMRISLESPAQPEVGRLIDALDALQKPLYPAASHHGIDLEALTRPNVLFAVARTDEGVAIGCGAIVLEDGYGELKRMFVNPSARGKGVAKALLAFLEEQAKARSCSRFMLETGCLQPEALALYARSGYVECGPFGPYSEDPNSVFMYKHAA
jgi:putative acetyltransferase